MSNFEIGKAYGVRMCGDNYNYGIVTVTAIEGDRIITCDPNNREDVQIYSKYGTNCGSRNDYLVHNK